MNKVSIYTLIILISISSCQRSNKKEMEALNGKIAALRNENETLRNKVSKQESSISAYKLTLEEIDFNLSKIQLNWSLVSDLKGESGLSTPVDERIKSRIFYIDNLIGNSQMKIMSLDKNLNELRKISSNQSEEVMALDRALKSSARTLIEKEEEFNRQKKALNLEFEDLEKVYEEQKAFTQELYKMLNRAFFYSGSSKDLKKNNIITKEGGFIGIGKVKILKANANESIFTLIEKDKSTQIPFTAKKIKFITSHPEGSFKIGNDKAGKVITILDQKAFWKVGNYLIIQTD